MIHNAIINAETMLEAEFKRLDNLCHQNTAKVIEAFQNAGLDEAHFYSVTGYGHNDLGREATDKIFAHVLDAEAACVRLQFVSGTHAIYAALRGILSPQQTLTSLTGAPYDTLEPVIGKRNASVQSLTTWGIGYQEIDCFSQFDFTTHQWAPEAVKVVQNTDVAFIQRSRGYGARPSLSIRQIEALISSVKAIQPHIKIMVDNCYGELTDISEPPAIGADIIAGSLIKNLGGGIVPTGGYIAGKKALVEAAAESMTAPGIGTEGGYTFDNTRLILQGLYFAPMIVKEALKSMRLFATVFESIGINTQPKPNEPQYDIIQTLEMGNAEKVLDFCHILQSASPVGSKLKPIPDATPGYADEVVMAGGTFVFGSTIELSADAPLREPYQVFLQGGVNYSHSRFVLHKMLEKLT